MAAPLRLLAFLVVLLPACAGCGLGAYEAKLEAEQKRLEAHDRQEGSLAPPLTPPEGAEIYLRPPHGIASRSDGIPLNRFFHRYPRGSSLADEPARPGLVAVSPEARKSEAFRAVLLAYGVDGDEAGFKTQILRTFPKAQALGIRKLERGGDALIFEGWTNSAEPGTIDSLFYHRKGNHLAAIIYRMEASKSGDEAVREAMENSLRTLRLGNEAAPLIRTLGSRP